MTNSQIGQAFGNDVLERSRPCRVAHVHSSRKWQWVAYVASDFFLPFWCINKSLISNADNGDHSCQTQQLLWFTLIAT